MQIYQILNKKTGKSYVGKSKDYMHRFEKHKKAAKAKVNRRLYDSMNHHGIDSFELLLLEELCNVTRQEANIRETYWIETLGTLMPNGYNMTKGGDGGNTLEFWSEEDKHNLYKQQGDKRRGKRNKEWCDAISKGATVREATKTPEQRAQESEKISNTLKEKYKQGIITPTLPPKKFGEDHPGYIKVDTELVLDLIKSCRTQTQISEQLQVPITAIRARLKELTGKSFLEWRREYGIVGRLSKPRVD
jgi:group I intron endonuclease